MQKQFWKGSRLLEILILFLILGTLAFLTVPYFKRFQCRSKQSEARMELLHLYQAEKLYFATHRKYALMDTLEQADLLTVKGKHYRFYSTKTDNSTFVIQAKGNKNSHIERDLWSIDQTGKLKHIQNACLD